MSTPSSPSPTRDYHYSIRALALVCVSVLLGWVLFICSVYVGEFGPGDSAAYVGDVDQALPPSYTPLWIFAAIAAVGAGALVASRATAQALNRSPGLHIARSVRTLALTLLIISAALSALAAVILFLSNFDAFGGGTHSVLSQVVDVYLPIVLHTALVVTLILAGFVFSGPELQTSFAGTIPDSPAPHAGKREVALGFALPIIVTCAALLAGLILSDLAPAIPSVWVWVIVVAGATVGILLGTRFASTAVRSVPVPNAAVGAHALNLVLVILLAVVAAVSSLGFGGGAVSELRAAPSLSINLNTSISNVPESISVWGSDVRRGSTVELVAQPSGEIIAQGTVDTDSWLSIDAPITEPFAAGAHKLSAVAKGRDGRDLNVEFEFTIGKGGIVADGSALESSQDLDSESTGVTAPWLGRSMLPAALLILLAVGSLAFSIRLRDPQPSQAPGNFATATTP